MVSVSHVRGLLQGLRATLALTGRDKDAKTVQSAIDLLETVAEGQDGKRTTIELDGLQPYTFVRVTNPLNGEVIRKVSDRNGKLRVEFPGKIDAAEVAVIVEMGEL